MSKFAVGDRVVWTCGVDEPVKATIATIGDDPKYADLEGFDHDYQLVIDEEYLDDYQKFLYGLSRMATGDVIMDAAYEHELEALDE